MRSSSSRILPPLLAAAVALLLAGCAGLGVSSLWRRVTLVAPGERARNFREMDRVFPARTIARSGPVDGLERSPRAVAAASAADDPLVDDAFVLRTRTAGLLVLEGDAIVHERYRLGADERSRFTSWSMAKSVVSTLVGVALAEGRIRSLDDAVSDYAPALRGTAYDGVAIRDVLQMASGVRFDERYDHALSDIRKLFYKLIFGGVPVRSTLATARHEGAPGLAVHYASLDTQALGAVLAGATGEPVARYLERSLWGPLGMEGDASWNLDRPDSSGGEELAFCCLNATLRDWARFGRFVRDTGVPGEPAAALAAALPPGWIEEATRVARPLGAPGTIAGTAFGYGYQWWIPPDADGEFLAIGVYGQYLYVNRPADVVIVKVGADPAYRMDDEAHIAFFRRIVRRLRGGSGALHAHLGGVTSPPARP